MAVTHATVASGSKYVIGNAIMTHIGAAGKLKFQNAGATATYATLTMHATTIGTVNSTSGVITFDCTTFEDTSASAGTSTKALVEQAGGEDVLYCAVATSGSDINMSSNAFGAGDTVQVTALSYTPPS